MAVKLGSLLIELGLDSAKFRSGTRSAQREMSTFQRGVSNSANLVKGALVGMVATIGIGTFTTAIREGLDYASSLGEVAQQLGVTTRTLQEYRYAATQTGITQEAMETSLLKLTRALGTAPEKFERLGIATRDANGNFRDIGEIIPELAEKLKGLDAAEQIATLNGLGRGLSILRPLLIDGASGVDNLRNAAQRLGIVLSDQQIQNADETADKLAAIQTVLNARLASAVADNADDIVKLADSLANLAEWAVKGASAWGRFLAVADRRISNTMTFSPFASDRAEGRSRINALDRAEFGGERIRINPAPLGHVPGTPYGPRSNFVAGTARRRPSYQRGAGPTRNFIDDLSDQALNGAPRLAAGLREVTAAATAARPALRAATPELQSLLDTLFPDRVPTRELAESITLLDRALRANQITVAQHGAAVAAANVQYREAVGRITDWSEFTVGAFEAVNGEIPTTAESVRDLADTFEEDADRMADAAERSQRAFYSVLDGLRGLSEGIKRGDFFSILEGVLGILNSIGSTRPGGLNIAGLNFGGQGAPIPGFANGTNFAPGGLAWVGERGRELVNLPRGSQVTPNNKLAGMGMNISVEASPYFDVRVDGRVLRTAPGIASAGAKGAMLASQRIGQRRLA